MIQLLEELRQEAINLTTKSLGPIGFDYRRRTRVERLLFLISKTYCIEKLSFELGGLGYNHKKSFNEYVKNNQICNEYTKVVKVAFEISSFVCNLSSSDPYVQEETLEELGGTIYSMLDNLRKRILHFIDDMSNIYGHNGAKNNCCKIE